MGYNTHFKHRRSIRLPHWDYRDDGAYFVSICTHDRTPMLGRIVADEMVPNPLGRIVEDVWRNVIGAAQSVGEFVVMPNHIHGIVWIEREPIVESRASVVVEQLRRGLRDGLEPGSLFVIVRTFKSAAAKRINNARKAPGVRVWQRDYYERVLRNDRELDRAHEYILDNARKWAEDKHNPAVFRKQTSRG